MQLVFLKDGKIMSALFEANGTMTESEVEIKVAYLKHFFGDLHTKPLGSSNFIFKKAVALIASAYLAPAIFYLNKKSKYPRIEKWIVLNSYTEISFSTKLGFIFACVLIILSCFPPNLMYLPNGILKIDLKLPISFFCM